MSEFLFSSTEEYDEYVFENWKGSVELVVFSVKGTRETDCVLKGLLVDYTVCCRDRKTESGLGSVG